MLNAFAQAFVIGFALCIGCGGGGGSSGGGAGGSSGGGGGDAVADPTEDGRRLAEQDAECDHGGASGHTCQLGLSCCYGPPEDPGERGSCQPECEY